MNRYGKMFAGALAAWAFGSSVGAMDLPRLKAEDWRRMPSDEERRAAWPIGASDATFEGEAGMECAVDGQGRLAGCKVLYEEPGGQGFGAAALKLAPLFQMKASGQGAATPATIRIPVSFFSPSFVPPDWLAKPTPEDMMIVWPTEALRKRQGGSAVIRCSVGVQGLLLDCKVMEEEPAGAGFGAAAIALTPQFVMRPGRFNGKPVVSEVRISMRFPKEFAPEGIMSNKIVAANRDWLEAPTYFDVAAAYPAKARAKRIAGYANLACSFKADGALRNCDVVSEKPGGYGFGAAARALAKQFRAHPNFADGAPVGGVRVQLPVAFATEMLDAKTPTLGKPTWAALPSAEQARDAYPAAADKAGVNTGRAVLGCMVEAEGKVACKVQGEEPAGYGFGEAALKLAPYFRLNTWTLEGLPTIGAAVRMPVRFQMDSQRAAAAPPAATPKP